MKNIKKDKSVVQCEAINCKGKVTTSCVLTKCGVEESEAGDLQKPSFVLSLKVRQLLFVTLHHITMNCRTHAQQRIMRP